jgi:hypothetical protein
VTPKIVRRWKRWGIGVVLFLIVKSLLLSHGLAVGLLTAVVIVPLGAFCIWLAATLGIVHLFKEKK